jgi:mono/diheme cytochrome c family protein
VIGGVLAVKWVGLLCLAAMAAGNEAFAAGDGVDVSRGAALARSWCSECHAVGRGQSRSPSNKAPSFTAVARLPSNSETAIRAFLQTPHPNMPNVKLAPAEIDEIVAYILSLR